MNAAIVVRRLAAAGALLCLVVVVLGAWVRLTAEGLGCPDWPGCYGHVTPAGAAANLTAQAAWPDTQLDIGKAWREMVHRYAAATLGLLIVLVAALAIAARGRAAVSVPFALALLATVVFQGALGMLTVTWQLKPLVVTLHLLGGLTTLAMLCWLYLSARAATRDLAATSDRAPTSERVAATISRPDSARTAQRLVIAALATLAVQIALGGWTSSNYAAVACPYFPTCQGEWWPATDYPDAFVLWRGLGINYEGGVLEHPARVAIHFTHRLGAIVVTIALLLAAVAVLRHIAHRRARQAALALLVALGLQLGIGILMVVKAFPLSLATAHNAGAALLVLAAVGLLHATRRAA